MDDPTTSNQDPARHDAWENTRPQPTATDTAEYLVNRPVPEPRTQRAYPEDARSAPPNMEDYREMYQDRDVCPTTCGRAKSGRPAQETSDTEQSDAITELLAAAGTAIVKRRGKTALLPHLFVVRGENRQKVAVGEATWHEYIAALCNMSKVVEVPATWCDPILEHLHQLASMAADREWETCRLWSE